MSRIEKGTQRFRPALPVRGDANVRSRQAAVQRTHAPSMRASAAEQPAAPARSYAFGAPRPGASRVRLLLTAYNDFAPPCSYLRSSSICHI